MIAKQDARTNNSLHCNPWLWQWFPWTFSSVDTEKQHVWAWEQRRFQWPSEKTLSLIQLVFLVIWNSKQAQETLYFGEVFVTSKSLANPIYIRLSVYLSDIFLPYYHFFNPKSISKNKFSHYMWTYQKNAVNSKIPYPRISSDRLVPPQAYFRCACRRSCFSWIPCSARTFEEIRLHFSVDIHVISLSLKYCTT